MMIKMSLRGTHRIERGSKADMTAQEPRSRFGGHALNVVVRFHGAVAEDVLVGPSGTLRRGGQLPLASDGSMLLGTIDGPLAVVLPEGQTRFGSLRMASGVWRFQDQAGQLHPIPPQASLELEFGNLTLTLRPVRHFFLSRELPADMMAFGMVALCMILGGSIQALVSTRPAPQSMQIQESPELIARLLSQDYEGVDNGSTMMEPEFAPQYTDFFLPAGDKGNFNKMQAGAEEPKDARDQANSPKQEMAPQDEHSEMPETLDEAEQEAGPKPAKKRLPDGDTLDGADDKAEKESASDAENEGWGYKDQLPAEQKEAQRVAEELAQAEEALRLDPDSPWALAQVARYQYLSEDMQGARRTYERYIEARPESASGYNNLGLVYKRLGDFEKEEELYRLALDIEPDDTAAMNNLAVNLAHQARYEEALGLMDRVEVLEPGQPYAQLHRAKIYAAMDNPERALISLDRALAGMAALDTLHHIEFRQDIRVDPALDPLRERAAFTALLVQYYGEEGRSLVGSPHG
ncbi:MAG: tetratricopeptide (TPR) repeat protein [Cognaticolwellia sp.]|jgi:tetratricopeptide (TPR) repeat protein